MGMTLYLSWAIAGTALLFALATVLWLMRPFMRIGAYRPQTAPADTAPKVSVIVYSQVTEERLMEYLETLCSQDYPDFEVIVVCESTAESSEILAESCTRRFNNVYVTFIPPGSHNLSRRKLALTLGMKAAKGEIVVTTVSNARIPSLQWLTLLTAPFRGKDAESIEISLGYSHIDYSEMKGWGKWYREFNALLTDAQWIGYALAGSPYRGDGYNLAFRKKLFFEHKGYSQSIYLHPGDDDIFINEVATTTNTALVLDHESILSIEWDEASKRMWRARKEQYDFTSRWLPRKPFLYAGAISLMQWVILFLCIMTVCVTASSIHSSGSIETIITEHLPALITIVMACLTLVLFWLAEIIVYRRTAAGMEATRLWWALPVFWLSKPVLNCFFKLRHRHQRRKNYTWMRG